MFDSILKFFKKFSKEKNNDSKDTAKERLHLVLMQDRANVSADFLELMKQEIIEVIKKYIDVDENLIDVKLTNKINNDGTTGAPALYANIPIVSIKDETRKINVNKQDDETDQHKKGTENQAKDEENQKENDKQTKNEKNEKENDKQAKSEKTQKENNKQDESEKQTQNDEQAKKENVKESKSEEEKQEKSDDETKQKEKNTKAS